MPRHALLAVVLALLIPAAPARAQQAVAEFYAGRQITMVVGFNTGGAYDLYARAMARHMGRHIPGTPGFIVKNTPGAGSMIAANHLYNAAAKDGSEIGLVAETVVIDGLMGVVSTRFDARQFTWIGSVAKSIAVCLAWHTSPIKTAKDLYEREMVVGTTGTSTLSYPMLLKTILGMRLRLVSGYAGTAGLMLALERGEVEAMCGQIYDAVKTQRPDWLAKGLVRPVVQIGLEKAAELGDVGWAMELARTDEDRRVIALVVGSTFMGRPFLAPPGVPAERREALRKAFAATMKDPQFLADAEKHKLDVSPVSGADIEAFVASAYATPGPIIERAKAVLSGK